MNSVAVDLVAALRRPVMPSFHAAWSFGGLAGAGLGGLLAPHLSPLRHLALVGLAGLLVAASAACALLTPAPLAAADPPDAPASTSPAAAPPGWRQVMRLGRLVGVLGLIALCAAYDEGAIGDWGALHLKQDLGAGAGLAAAGYAVFALAEATGRLSGTALLERHGRTRVLITGGLTACAGMLLAALAPDVWLALAGFAATGLGLSNLFPTAVARAGLLAGTNGVAFASTIGYCGFLLGPPAIGFLASEFGLRAGLVTLSFLGLAAAVIAYADSGRTRRVRRALPGSGALVTRTSLTAEPVQSILSMQYSVCPVGGPLSVRHSLLALLNRGPMHGYGLKTEFEAATADVWPLNVGQVYTTLARLERDRLVTAEADSDGQKVYGITEAGRDELRRWFETPIEREAMPRQELTIKLVFALRSGAANVAAVVRRQRVATVRSLQDVTRLKAAAESEGDTAWLLMLEALVFQAEAEVRWLDLCEARLSGPDAAPGRRVNAAVPQPIAPKHGVQERKVERSG
jgi:DNA-binding PadR family transcriptional regulator